jgi:hypothetical protein
MMERRQAVKARPDARHVAGKRQALGKLRSRLKKLLPVRPRTRKQAAAGIPSAIHLNRQQPPGEG